MFKHAALRRWEVDLWDSTLTPLPAIGSGIEIDPSEAGKEWIVPYDMVVLTDYKPILIYGGFVHDADTFVINFEERDPVIPIHLPPIPHDFGFVHRIWADGTPMAFHEINHVYYDLCAASTNWKRRQVAELHYTAVASPAGWLTWHGWPPWGPCKKAKLIPLDKQYLYGTDPSAIEARSHLPTFGVVDGRIRRVQ